MQPDGAVSPPLYWHGGILDLKYGTELLEWPLVERMLEQTAQSVRAQMVAYQAAQRIRAAKPPKTTETEAHRLANPDIKRVK